MPLFGSDFAGWEDLDQRLTVLEGESDELTAVAQSLARRLSTPRGGLFYDPNYGYDLRSLVGDTMEPSNAAMAIEAECRKDERVKKVKAEITVVGDSWTIAITGTAKNGEAFALTLGVSQVTITLLKGG